MNHYEINVALPVPVVPGYKYLNPARYLHYFRTAKMPVTLDVAKKIAAELQSLYPDAKITMTCWNEVGTDIPL